MKKTKLLIGVSGLMLLTTILTAAQQAPEVTKPVVKQTKPTTEYQYVYIDKKVPLEEVKKNIGADHFIFRQGNNTTIKTAFEKEGYYFIKGTFKVDLSRYGRSGFVDQPFEIIISKDGKVAIAKGTLLDKNQQIIEVSKNLEANRDKAAFKIGHGPKNIFVFTDPDCPFCVRLSDRMKNLKEDEYTIYVYFFPLDRLHPNARKKAEYILSLPKDQRREAYKKLQGLKVTDGEWKTSDTSKGQKLLEPMVKYGQEFVGVTGTPFVVNSYGQRIDINKLFKQ